MLAFITLLAESLSAVQQRAGDNFLHDLRCTRKNSVNPLVQINLSLSLLRGTLRLMSTKDQNAPSQRRLAGLLDGEGATAPRSWATLAHNPPLMKRIINAVPHLWRHT
jgi:hypothetical protein